MARRPRIFIGSSTPGLKYAEALHARLDLKSEATVWDQHASHLSKATLENLAEQARSVDFAALVLTPDDLLTRGGEERSVARDNVLFEAGLFMGALGPERAFLVCSRDQEIALPTDLLGIAQARWGDRADENWDAALSVPARQILQEMKEVRLHSAEEETLFDSRQGLGVEPWTVERQEGARGEVTGGNNVIRIERQNGDGKLWLWLARRIDPGSGGEKVIFRISGDARTSEGEHTFAFVFKKDGAPPGTHLVQPDPRRRVSSRWQSLDATHEVTLNRPCRIRIEHRSPSVSPSAAEIRDLVITVTRYPFDLEI